MRRAWLFIERTYNQTPIPITPSRWRGQWRVWEGQLENTEARWLERTFGLGQEEAGWKETVLCRFKSIFRLQGLEGERNDVHVSTSAKRRETKFYAGHVQGLCKQA